MTGAPDVRVALVDDQTLVRHGIRSLLEIAGGFEVVAEADDGAAGVAVVEQHRPDVVLLDLRMPGTDGLWALDELRRRRLEVPVLVLTTFDDDELLLRALRAGAQGYLLKDVTVTQLAGAVRALADGGTHVQPSVTARLVRAIGAGSGAGGAGGDRAGAGGSAAHRDAFVQPLTDRETEVLRLMAEGCTNREIAGVLHLAPGTVKNHVSAVLLKLDTTDRTKAVLRALHHGLLG